MTPEEKLDYLMTFISDHHLWNDFKDFITEKGYSEQEFDEAFENE